MSQMEELKMFVSERLHAAASEILGAFEKTITDYEEQASRLKEENDRHRSLLDIILKAKIPKTQGRSTKSTPAAAGPCASDSSTTSKGKETPCSSAGLQCGFTSRIDLLKLAGRGNCPYCLKSFQATETHLIKKHYQNAVHFNDNGTEKFVIPCTCTDLIQGRSHWHCPYCIKIIYRRSNFEVHISKQHGYAILQQSQDAAMDQPPVSAFEEVPLNSEPWCQQDQQASLLLQVKEEEVSHPEWQNSVQLQIEVEQIQKGSSQMSLEEDHVQDSAADIVCVDSYIQDLGETLNIVESGDRHLLPNSSHQPLETQPDSVGGGILQPAGESQHTTPCSSVKPFNTKRKVHMKRSLPPLSLKMNKSTQLPVSRNPKGPHICKACGKTFHYMYTLKSHTQTHAADKTHICGICGKHLESKESLVQHLRSHTKRNKCGTCGKHFSNNSRLKRHSKFHRPKGLNVMSSA